MGHSRRRHLGGAVRARASTPGWSAARGRSTRREGATLHEGVRCGGWVVAGRARPDQLERVQREHPGDEPSERFGDRYVQVLRDVLDAPVADAAGEVAQDSSDGDGTVPAGLPVGPVRLALAGAGGLVVLAIVTWVRRRRATRGRHSRCLGQPSAAARLRTAGTTLVIVVAAATSLVGLPGADVGIGTADPDHRNRLQKTEPSQPSRFFQGAQPVDHPSRVVIASAGDIARAADPAGFKSEERNSAIRCQSEATAALVDTIAPDAVLTLGDNQYPNGSHELPNRLRPHLGPGPGHHQARARQPRVRHQGAQGYFDYSGRRPDRRRGIVQPRPGSMARRRAQLRVRHTGGCEAGPPRSGGCGTTSRPSCRRARSGTGTSRCSPPAATGAPPHGCALASPAGRRGRARAERPRPRLRAVRSDGRDGRPAPPASRLRRGDRRRQLLPGPRTDQRHGGGDHLVAGRLRYIADAQRLRVGVPHGRPDPGGNRRRFGRGGAARPRTQRARSDQEVAGASHDPDQEDRDRDDGDAPRHREAPLVSPAAARPPAPVADTGRGRPGGAGGDAAPRGPGFPTRRAATPVGRHAPAGRESAPAAAASAAVPGNRAKSACSRRGRSCRSSWSMRRSR